MKTWLNQLEPTNIGCRASKYKLIVMNSGIL